jgi:hypothetical protein
MAAVLQRVREENYFSTQQKEASGHLHDPAELRLGKEP